MPEGQLVPAAPTPAQAELSSLQANITFFLLGLFSWEYVQSLDLEYAAIWRRSSFRLSFVPYVVGRLSLLIYFVLLIIQSRSALVTPLMCDAGAYIITVLGVIVLWCASAIFTIRTWVIWKDSYSVHALQVLLVLGQWVLFVLNVMNIHPNYESGVCVATLSYPKVSAASLIYSMCFDLFTFVLLVVGLARQKSESPLKKRLRTQGTLYFAVASIANIPPVVFVLLNETFSMVIFTNVALTASIIVACRAVRSLLSFDACLSRESGDNNIALTTQIAIGSMGP